MKNIQSWLDEYAVSHQNPTNKMVHYFCVPLIFFSIVGMFYSIPFSLYETSFFSVNIATLALVFVFLYYLRLSFPLAVGMLLFSLACLVICHQISLAGLNVFWVSAGIFVIAWIFQFWGHKVEGQKPSFLKDLQFLMIGPAWIMSFIYKKLGI